MIILFENNNSLLLLLLIINHYNNNKIGLKDGRESLGTISQTISKNRKSGTIRHLGMERVLLFVIIFVFFIISSLSTLFLKNNS